jgi:hypothetical protein
MNLVPENINAMCELIAAITLFVSLKDENKDFFILNPNWIEWAKKIDATKENILSMIDSEIYCQNHPELVEKVRQAVKENRVKHLLESLK